MQVANPRTARRPAARAEVRAIARAINGLAEANAALKATSSARSARRTTRIEQERNRLAALMSELAQSVIVCNVEGRILLYNARAMQLLRKPLDSAAATGKAHTLVGLGRSIFAIFDRNLIIHALESIHDRIRKGERAPVANFVTTAPAGQLVRVQLAPVLGAATRRRRRDRGHRRLRAAARRHHAAHRDRRAPRPAAAGAHARDARVAREHACRGGDHRVVPGHGARRAGPVHRHHRRRSAHAERSARPHGERVRGFAAHRVAARGHARRRPHRGRAPAHREPAAAADQARGRRRGHLAQRRQLFADAGDHVSRRAAAPTNSASARSASGWRTPARSRTSTSSGPARRSGSRPRWPGRPTRWSSASRRAR